MRSGWLPLDSQHEGCTLVVVTHDAQVAALRPHPSLVDGTTATDLELDTCPESYDETTRSQRVGAVTEVMAAIGV